MATTEENMTNLKEAKTRLTLGDIRTLTRAKRGNCHGYQRRDGKLHHMMSSDTEVIPCLHENIFSVT